MVGTDGALSNGIGTTGVVFRSENKIIITTKSAELCGYGHLDSTREELRAQLSAEIILDACGKQWGKKNQTVTYICDSKAALSVINKSKGGNEYFNPHQAEIDVIREIQKIKDNNNNIQRTYRWVESHQDNENNDIEINNIADSLATEAHDNVLQGLQMAYPKQGFLECKATIKINGHIVTKDLKTTITKALYTVDMDKYMKKSSDGMML